ncbi:MAG: hypothetical protein ACTSQF_09870 [Candidatus Heimdallarchaeaceae archaeon]
MIKLGKSKKGQLFIIEAFIAVSVMIIMVTALYEVQLATQPSVEPEFHEEVYTALQALDANGFFDNYIYSINSAIPADITYYRTIITAAIYGALPDHGEFKLHYEDLQTSVIVSESHINEHLTTGDSVVSIDYLITEVYGEYAPYTIHLQVWLKG